MNNFIQSKRPQLIILISFIVAYLIALLITSYATSVKVIEFAFITISFGFAPAYYFRSTFKFRNVVGWILNAAVLGLLFIPFLFLFLGWLKINIVFEHSITFLYLCSLIGLLSLFFWAQEDDIKSCLNVSGINKVDTLIAIVFMAFTAILTLKNFIDIYINWDIFTFWGLDAKYIFEQNHLRDLSFHSDVIIHRYTSFQPLYYSIIYDLYGGIYEQYAAWINIYINLLAMLLIYGYVQHKEMVHKFIVSAVILIVSYAAIDIMKVFSMYADILIAFLLMVFFLILFDDTKKTTGTYWRRISLLLLIAISFYFIKSHFLYFSFILIGIWLLYDGSYIYNNGATLMRKKSIWLAVLSVIILIVMRFEYFSNIGGVSSSEKVDLSYIVRIKSGSIISFIQYLVGLLEYMIRNNPFFFGLWWLTLGSILFVKDINKKYIFIYASAILIFLMPVGSYVMRQLDLQSGSLPRYSAMVMYIFPLAISFVHIESVKLKRIASGSIFGVVVFFVFLSTLWSLQLKEEFSISPGTLQPTLTKYDQYAKEVINITGPNARILIADDIVDNQITNMNVPAIFIRYFMMYNSVGSQYVKPTSSILDYAKENSANYILLLSYADSLEYCEDLLSADHDYLIDIGDGNINIEPETCQFSSFTIQDLSQAVR